MPANVNWGYNAKTHADNPSSATCCDKKEGVFRQSFHWEQELTVAAGVAASVDKFECRIMKSLCLMPLVRFAFFPRWRYIWF